MSGAIKGVLGVIAIAAGALIDYATGGTGGNWLIKVGAALLLNAAAEALGPKPPRAPPLSGIDVAYSGTLEPGRLIYGQIKVGGMHGIPPP